jgi:aspartate/methionine/tyrosine aminotransferase
MRKEASMVDREKPPGIAAKVLAAKRSSIRVIFDLAGKMSNVIRLEIGEPRFTTPDHIIQGGLKAACEGFTRYTPNGGLRSLRELLAEKIRRVNKYSVDPDQIVVTPGGMNALYSIYLVLLNPGDEVLLPTPGFPNMDEMVRILGGTPVFYSLSQKGNYLPDLHELESLVTERTKAVFFNTPGNPTGAVFPERLVQSLVDFAHRRRIWMISDEVYDQMVLDDDIEHVSAGRFDREGYVISVHSFSKVHAMTGWRLGYCIAQGVLADNLRKVQEPLCSCPSSVSQKAAEAALSGPQTHVDSMRDAYREARNRAWAVVTEQGLKAFKPQGTFYMLIDVSESGMSSSDFTMKLLKEEKVAVAPGEVFGPGGQGLVRISVAGEISEIEEGIRRLAKVIKRSKPSK